jgi:UDP-N-acetyl-D-glucosamine dehydrogenase
VDALNDAGKAARGSKILVIGVAYKKDIDDIRESPALDIIRLLERRGAHVTYHDPFIAQFTEDGLVMKSVPLNEETVRGADCCVIVTDHSTIDYGMLRQAKAMVDTRHVLPRAGRA